MKRLLIIYNPRSSQFAQVEEDVLNKVRGLNGYMVGKYEIKKTGYDDNVNNLKKIIKDDDLVVAVGGDATASMAANAILESNKKVTFSVLPYGNFNDFARTLRVNNIDEILNGKSTIKYYPLEIKVNGEHFRFATCYVTVGMTAEAVKIFDKPLMRRKLRSFLGRKIGSYITLSKWYFKQRKRSRFIPEFWLNEKEQSKKMSDYFAVNGRRVAGIMNGNDYYGDPKRFESYVGKLGNFFRLMTFMIRSIFRKIPGKETVGDEIKFSKPTSITIQAEGESRKFEEALEIEIRKSDKYLTVRNS